MSESFAVDAAMAAILADAAKMPAPDYTSLPLAEGRATFERLAAAWNIDAPGLAQIRTVNLPDGAGGSMRGRLFVPVPAEPLPLVVYLHGGGWTFGSVETHHRAMAHLAEDSGCAVLGIDYRLAPEYPYPAALDDVAAAVDAIADGALGAGIDARRMALAGDSAGAGIALASLKVHGVRARIAAATLFYGCYAPVFDTPSHKAFGAGGYLLTSERMRWYWKNWQGVAPAAADLAGLPAIYLNAAGLDPLRDETFDLAKRLAEAGNDVRFDLYAGVCHGFMQMSQRLPAARRALRDAGEFLKSRLQR
jgi:acetyl esterase